MRFSLLALVGSAALSHAWLPSDKDLFGANSTDATEKQIAAGKGRMQTTWLPASGKIRGVNLGSLFIVEPWMASNEWRIMGCGDAKSEFDCVRKLGQGAANTAFQGHWSRWITENDIATMRSYGLNTIRIPVGYWMMESIVYKDSEYFPQGGLAFLDKVVGWASNNGMYIIIDLHGAPGAQVANQPFTGQYAPSAGFYQSWQYDRAYKFLQFMTNRIHTNNAYRNVGMLEVLNEPIGGQPSLVSTFYPTALNKIRETERALGKTSNNFLHVQFMNSMWGAGNPAQNLGDRHHTAYDNHRYPKWDPSVPKTQSGYLQASCRDNVAADGLTPLIVGEWSISPADDVEWNGEFEISSGRNSGFYRKWWAAQVMAYEKQAGWVFWSWKNELNDFRWGYKQAVEQGIIPKDPNQAWNQGAC
ncbi:hypothetical protein W97_07877 [Coniosporium apollinis CBS 100218]|uniref:glucan endo-1,6-beta-glucosidase n=1 Tax=Coniosporium apollinis (strain CBS 100218) TaxID=1168221 RepID=R7Z3N9_CONA1|nr:uncharacterized protein W97_07877 [Coniosporium apollinis CBS 100218]EON68619.1 hypothetical protein W97_07877 [Coniosporium apollinis CBS 100218]